MAKETVEKKDLPVENAEAADQNIVAEYGPIRIREDGQAINECMIGAKRAVTLPGEDEPRPHRLMVRFTPQPKPKGWSDKEYGYYLYGTYLAVRSDTEAASGLLKVSESRSFAAAAKDAGIGSAEELKALLAKLQEK